MASSLVELAGHASTADAFRLTDTHDEGRGAVAAIRPHAARDNRLNVAHSHSFGFGGQNTTLVLRRFSA